MKTVLHEEEAEGITQDFLERLVDESVKRILRALEGIDISLDFLATGLLDQYSDPASVQARQKFNKR